MVVFQLAVIMNRLGKHLDWVLVVGRVVLQLTQKVGSWLWWNKTRVGVGLLCQVGQLYSRSAGVGINLIKLRVGLGLGLSARRLRSAPLQHGLV